MSFSRQVGRRAATLVALGVLLVVFAGCAGQTSLEKEAQVGQYRVNIKLDPVTLNPPQLGSLTYSVTDTRNDRLVSSFEEISGAVLHHILISRDLQYFRHSYSEALVQVREGEQVKDSHASVLTYFPGPGTYYSYALFKPEGVDLQVYTSTISTGGEGAEPALVETPPGPKTQGWLTFNLAREETIRSGGPTQLVLHVSERGRPVSSLWPYLDAPGHLWLVDEHGENFAHVLAAAELRPQPTTAADATQAAGTPTARATGTARPEATGAATPQDESGSSGSTTGGTGGAGGGEGDTRTGGPSAPVEESMATPLPVPSLVPGVRNALATLTAVPQPTLAPVQQTAQPYLAATPELLPTVGYGPDLVFTHTFEEGGLYKLWFEVQYRGQVVLADFVVRVED